MTLVIGNYELPNTGSVYSSMVTSTAHLSLLTIYPWHSHSWNEELPGFSTGPGLYRQSSGPRSP